MNSLLGSFLLAVLKVGRWQAAWAGVMAVWAGLAAPCVGQNLALNPGFESGTTGWFAWGPATISVSTAQAHAGTRSALVQNRTETYAGIAQSMLGKVKAGTNYAISAWVRLASGGSQPVLLTIQKVDGAVTTYTTVASGTATSTNWTQLTGGYALTFSNTLTALNLYMEQPAAGVSFYADDFSIVPYDWKGSANARIEQMRKRDTRLSMVDAAGQPVAGVAVAVKQTGHAFAFGSAINDKISNPSYASFFRTNFEWAVMENDSKWAVNEPTRGNVTYAAADRITNFCFNNGITLRGHTLFWAVDEWVQPWVKGLSDGDLRVHMTNRVKSAVNHFKGIFQHWDVNNEMLHGNYYGNRLGDEINAWMFRFAREQDPVVRLFVNDYNVVAGDETEAYKAQIRALTNAGAPVGGIGVQGHFGGVIDPRTTELRLDSLAELGLPIWITEYDSLNADETVRADNLEILYRTAFSKSAVEGVLMWGFWAASHWRGQEAAIVNTNWTLNAAGRRYQALRAEWTTITNGVTSASGQFDFRGFHGSYDVMITPPGGLPTLRRITVDPAAGTNFVTLVAHASGPQPILHSPLRAGSGGAFQFQLTGDAGRIYSILASTNIGLGSWKVQTNIANPTGTIGFTKPDALTNASLFFRAQQL